MTLSEVIAGGTLVVAPLPLGSVDPVWPAVWTVSLAASLAVVRVSGLTRERVLVLTPLLILVGLAGLVVLLQHNTALGRAANLWERTSRLLQVPLVPQSSVAQFGFTGFGSSAVLSCIAVPTLYFVAANRGAARRLIYLLVTAGTCYAVYAMLDLVMNPPSSSGAERILSWPFFDRNHDAAFYGLNSTTLAILAVAELRRYLARRLGPEQNVAEAGDVWKVWVPAMGSLICLAATLLTLSRGGIAATLIAQSLTIALYVGRWLFPKRGSMMAAVPAIMLAIALVGTPLLGRVGYRISQEGLIDPGREEVYGASLRVISEYPWLGTGLGTFEDVIPAYRAFPPKARGVWYQAHSTPLEMAVELGLPFLGAFLTAWLFVAGTLLRGFFRRKRRPEIPLIGLAALLLGSLSTLVEFPLQIAGCFLVWAGFVAAGLSRSISDSSAA